MNYLISIAQEVEEMPVYYKMVILFLVVNSKKNLSCGLLI